MGDVVEALTHPGETVYAGWEAEECLLSDLSEASRRFLVRVPEAEKEKAAEIFPGAEPVFGGVEGELGLLTAELTESEFAAKAKSLNILGRIRVMA